MARQHGFVVEFCTDEDFQRLWQWRYGTQSRPFGRVLVLARVYADARRLWVTDSVLGNDLARMWRTAAAIEQAITEEVVDFYVGGVAMLERHGRLVAVHRVVTYKEEMAPQTARVTALALLAWAWAAVLTYTFHRWHGAHAGAADHRAPRRLRPSRRETA